MKLTLFILCLVALKFTYSQAHSWLDCIDWDGTTCKGYARNWFKQPSNPFGADVGRDIRPGQDVPGGLFCDPQKEGINNPVTAGYTATYPMASFKAGQKFTARWPAKNHANVGTQRGVQFFISKTPGGGDDFSHITSKEAWLTKYPELEKTFSNCNPNTPGVDRAPCTGEFEVPTDLAPGIYTFMWWWEFNGGEFYNSCADVLVSAADGGGGGGGGGGDADDAVAPPGTGDENDPCISSNFAANSCPLPSEPNVDGVTFVNPPLGIPSTGTFQVDVAYKASNLGSREVIVDVLEIDGDAVTFYGKGSGTIQSGAAGTLNINIALLPNLPVPTTSQNIVLKAWIVDKTIYDTEEEPWLNELARLDHSVSVGQSIVPCDAAQANSLASLCASSANGSSGLSSGSTALIISGVLVFLYVGIGIGFTYRNTGKMEHPHASAWSSFCGLAGDGFKYTFNKASSSGQGNQQNGASNNNPKPVAEAYSSAASNPADVQISVNDGKAETSAPGALPEGWEMVKDEASGDNYYHHVPTGKTQWDVPTDSSIQKA